MGHDMHMNRHNPEPLFLGQLLCWLLILPVDAVTPTCDLTLRLKKTCDLTHDIPRAAAGNKQ